MKNMKSNITRKGITMASDAFWGVFEDKTCIKVIIDKNMIAECLEYAREDEEIVVTQKHLDAIWKAVAETDLVGDFIEGVLTIAEEIVPYTERVNQ
jgi:hypothetical protein